jgi:hypothetical protein
MGSESCGVLISNVGDISVLSEEQASAASVMEGRATEARIAGS